MAAGLTWTICPIPKRIQFYLDRGPIWRLHVFALFALFLGTLVVVDIIFVAELRKHELHLHPHLFHGLLDPGV